MTDSVRRHESRTGLCAIKFLVPPAVTANLIGRRSEAIDSIISLSGATVRLKGPDLRFSWVSDAVILVYGSHDECVKAVKLIISFLACSKQAGDSPLFYWNPTIALPFDQNLSKSDLHVVIRTTIPMQACGVVLGLHGKVIQSIQKQSGARLHANSKDDWSIIKERIITVAGSVGACELGISLILGKICDVKKTHLENFIYKQQYLEDVSRSTSNEDVSTEFQSVGRDQTEEDLEPTQLLLLEELSSKTQVHQGQREHAVNDQNSKMALAQDIVLEESPIIKLDPNNGKASTLQGLRGSSDKWRSSRTPSEGSVSEVCPSENSGETTTATSSSGDASGGNNCVWFPPGAGIAPVPCQAQSFYPPFINAPEFSYYPQQPYPHYMPCYPPHVNPFNYQYPPHSSMNVPRMQRQFQEQCQPHRYQQSLHRNEGGKIGVYNDRASQMNGLNPSHFPPHIVSYPPLHLLHNSSGSIDECDAVAEVTDLLYALTTVEMSIPDEYIGSIFGKQGITIKELQSKCRCNIHISTR